MRSRAYRRHQEFRIAERFKRLWTHIGGDMMQPLLRDSAYIGKNISTRKRCSCFACGNIRKYSNELTRREVKQGLREYDD